MNEPRRTARLFVELRRRDPEAFWSLAKRRRIAAWRAAMPSCDNMVTGADSEWSRWTWRRAWSRTLEEVRRVWRVLCRVVS